MDNRPSASAPIDTVDAAADAACLRNRSWSLVELSLDSCQRLSAHLADQFFLMRPGDKLVSSFGEPRVGSFFTRVMLQGVPLTKLAAGVHHLDLVELENAYRGAIESVGSTRMKLIRVHEDDGNAWQLQFASVTSLRVDGEVLILLGLKPVASPADPDTSIENGGDALLLVDPELQVIGRSASMTVLVGEQSVGPFTFEFVNPADWGGRLSAGYEGKPPSLLHMVTFEDRSGVTRYAELEVFDHLNTPGVGAYIYNLRDVTSRVLAEQERNRTRGLFRVAMEHSSDALFLLDADLRVVYQSPAFKRIFGYETQPSPDINDSVVHVDDREAVLKTLRELVDGRSESRLTYRILRGDDLRWIECVYTNHLSDPDLRCLVCNVRDVTERIDAEQARKTAEVLLQSIWENSPDAVAVISSDGHALYRSPSYDRMFGLDSNSDVNAEFLMAFIHPDDRQKASEEFQQVRRSSVPIKSSMRVVVRGHVRYIEAFLTNRIDDPAIGGILLNCRDVTELVETEQYWRAILARSSDAIVVGPGHGAPTFRSDAFYRIFGVAPEDLEPSDNFQLIHPDDRSEVVRAYQELAEQPGGTLRLRFRIFRHDRVRWVEAVSMRNEAGDKNKDLISNIRDVTDEVVARQEIEALNKQMAASLEDLGQTRDRLQQLVTQLEQAREEERRRIAWVLHDEALQSLLAAKMVLDLGMTDGGLDEDMAQSCQNAVSTSVESMRRVVTELRPMISGRSLEDMLQEHVPSLLGDGIHWTLDVSGMDGVSDDMQHVVFRSVQEALRNVKRHSGASRVQVRVSGAGSMVKVEVVDNGTGVDLTELNDKQSHGHYGVASMQESAELRGGVFRILPAPSGGTCVELMLPV